MKITHLSKASAPKATLNQLTFWYCAWMLGAFLLFASVVALEVCSIFLKEITSSPEAWLAVFAHNGWASWTGIVLGVILTWKCGAKYKEVRERFDRLVPRPRREYEGVLFHD